MQLFYLGLLWQWLLLEYSTFAINAKACYATLQPERDIAGKGNMEYLDDMLVSLAHVAYDSHHSEHFHCWKSKFRIISKINHYAN